MRLQGNTTRGCSRITPSGPALRCAGSLASVLNKNPLELEHLAQAFPSGSHVTCAGPNAAPAKGKSCRGLVQTPQGMIEEHISVWSVGTMHHPAWGPCPMRRPQGVMVLRAG